MHIKRGRGEDKRILGERKGYTIERIGKGKFLGIKSGEIVNVKQ